jgi:hypothetical protein
MPVVIADNEGRSSAQYGLRDVKYSYDYPDGLDLRPKSKLHEKIVLEVMRRARDSHNVMQARHSAWKAIDETTTAYIRADEKESIVKAKDSRKPISIVVPQTYATLEILLTYMTASMLEDPMLRFEGTGPEDILGAILLEKVIQQQCYYTKAQMALHTMFRDGFCYGLSAVSPVWTTEVGWVSRSVPGMPTALDAMLGGTPGPQRVSVEETLFEGNRIENIDPYLFLPDPRMPIQKVGDGEFVGWIALDSIIGLLKEEKVNEDFFNVKYLKHLGTCTSTLTKNDPSGRATRSGISQQDSTYRVSSTTRPADVIWMYIDIIPEEWELSKEEYPETWLFGVAAEQIVIYAKPLNLNHNRKPVCTFAPDFDGYQIAPIARMEMINGLQTTLDWMFNSHVTNVRKSINDMLVVDPSMVNMDDLKDPEPGKLIRLRRSVWGRGVESAVKQLAVTDITRNNVGDAGMIMDLMKATSGSVDAVSGLRRKTSERVTAEEVRGDRFGGLSRLERLAKVAGWMTFRDLGFMMASQTQQLMSQETYVKIEGQWQDVLRQEYGITDPRMKVTPFDILISYDVMVRDGSIPGGNFADIWTQMLPQIMQDPEIRQRMDLVRVVKHIMRSLGAKDVNQFDRKQPLPPANQQMSQMQAQVQPDQQVQQQVQAGNLVPVGGQ